MTTDPKDAEIARLKTEIERLGRDLNRAKYGEPDFSWAIHNEAMVELRDRAEKAEAERDAALAREAALLASNQTNRDLLCQLTGAQSEVTHMRNRFDTAIAGAYEAAAQKVSHEWEKQQPWRNTGGMNATETCATIRAITTADAQAALDARINAAKEEGRIMGLREAFAMAEDYTPDKHALGGPAAHVTGKSIQNAILAKIKDAE